MPIIPATQEAEARELLWEAEVAVSCDCATALQPGNKVRPCLQKNKTNLTYAITWMNFEGSLLIDLNQTQKNE